MVLWCESSNIYGRSSKYNYNEIHIVIWLALEHYSSNRFFIIVPIGGALETGARQITFNAFQKTTHLAITRTSLMTLAIVILNAWIDLETILNLVADIAIWGWPIRHPYISYEGYGGYKN